MIDCGVLKQTTEIVQVNGGIWVAGKRGVFGGWLGKRFGVIRSRQLVETWES